MTEARPDDLPFVVRRPVGVLMVFVAAVVFGAFSIPRLPVRFMPDVAYPRVVVRTEYPAAAPAEVERHVARPLEEALGVVGGLRRIESLSRSGYCDVVLEFEWSSQMDDVHQDVLERIDAVRPTLPDAVETPLILRYDPSLDPVLILSVRGRDEAERSDAELTRMRRIADEDIRRMLEPIEGVAALKVEGGEQAQVEVTVDPATLQRLGLSIADIADRLDAENVDLAGGTLYDGRTRYLVRTVNAFRSDEDLGDVVVARREGVDLRLRDFAEIRVGTKRQTSQTRIEGVTAVTIEVYKEGDANLVAMARRVTRRIDDQLRPWLEETYGLDVEIVSDRARFVEASLREVLWTALLGGLIAVGVLLVFLRDVRSTAIVAVSIPVSVLVTFAPLQVAGVSLNIMSLGGLALGIGLLVDNSIVVLESIHRCRQEGDPVIAATVRGVSEVGGAVMAATLTSIAVFAPIAFVEGVAGQMFADLGWTVVFSLLASLLVALFLIPTLASRGGEDREVAGEIHEAAGLRGVGRTWRRWEAWRLARSTFAWMAGRASRRIWAPYVLLRLVAHVVLELLGKVVLTVVVALWTIVAWPVRRILAPLRWLGGGLVGVGAIGLAWLELAYVPILRACLRHRGLVALVVTTLGGLSVLAGMRVQTELLPTLRQGEFTADLRLPPGTPIETTIATMAGVEAALLGRIDDLVSLGTTIGRPADANELSERGEHVAQLRLVLDTGSDRPWWTAWIPTLGWRSPVADQEERAMAEVRRAARRVPGMTATLRRPALFSFKPAVEVEVRAHDLEQLESEVERMSGLVAGVPGVRDVRRSTKIGSPEVHVKYDHDALARAGLDARRVAELVRDEVDGREARGVRQRERDTPIRVSSWRQGTAPLPALEDLEVNPGGERPVPLRSIAQVTVARGPSEIRRIGQQRVGVITASLEGGVALGRVAADIERELARDRWAEGVTWEVTGQSQEWQSSSRSLWVALGLAVFLVYVITASLFENLVYPGLILLSIPLASLGVLPTLWVTGQPVSVVVLLGAIMLAGIVVNNAIVLVDYIGQLRRRGASLGDAIEQACRIRLRPILMTTLTTVLGLVPMALGVGEGAEIRAPMAWTVIVGLTASTLLTLLVIPTFYASVERLAGGGR